MGLLPGGGGQGGGRVRGAETGRDTLAWRASRWRRAFELDKGKHRPMHTHGHVIRPKCLLIKSAPLSPWPPPGSCGATGLTTCPRPHPQAVCYLILCSCCGHQQPPSAMRTPRKPHAGSRGPADTLASSGRKLFLRHYLRCSAGLSPRNGEPGLCRMTQRPGSSAPSPAPGSGIYGAST